MGKSAWRARQRDFWWSGSVATWGGDRGWKVLQEGQRPEDEFFLGLGVELDQKKGVGLPGNAEALPADQVEGGPIHHLEGRRAQGKDPADGGAQVGERQKVGQEGDPSAGKRKDPELRGQGEPQGSLGAHQEPDGVEDPSWPLLSLLVFPRHVEEVVARRVLRDPGKAGKKEGRPAGKTSGGLLHRRVKKLRGDLVPRRVGNGSDLGPSPLPVHEGHFPDVFLGGPILERVGPGGVRSDHSPDLAGLGRGGIGREKISAAGENVGELLEDDPRARLDPSLVDP